MRHFPAGIALVFTASLPAQPNPNLPLDHPYTLRDPNSLPTEMEMARQISGAGPQFYILPRPCFSELDSSRVCGETHGFTYRDSARNRQLSLSPQLGYEFRRLRENAHAFELGALASGNNGPVSFYLDARMFSESHEDRRDSSYDREFVERQDQTASGSVAYTSYSRFRANLSYDLSWGRFSAGRDAVHWGPSLYNNLVFNQNAVPFNQLTFTTHLGPVAVHTLYGQLEVEVDRVFGTDPKTRSVYAHRYEWNATQNLLLGISEQLIVYGYEEPFAFIPVMPLFIFKDDTWTRLNNGNIAGDFCYRLPGFARFYSEFLIDDIQSPTSLFDSQWGNKWGWTAGTQWVKSWRSWETGAALEYAHIEPWVYTHYLPATAQAANQGYPLGNQGGPGMERFTGAAWIVKNGLTLELRGNVERHARGPGSNVLDTAAGANGIKGVNWRPWRVAIEPSATLAMRNFVFVLGVRLAPMILGGPELRGSARWRTGR